MEVVTREAKAGLIITSGIPINDRRKLIIASAEPFPARQCHHKGAIQNFTANAKSASPQDVRSRITVDWHMLSDVKLQPPDVAEQRNGVGIDIRQVPSCGRPPADVGVDRDLLLGAIHDCHVVAVVETFDVIELDHLVAIADRIGTVLAGTVSACVAGCKGTVPIGTKAYAESSPLTSFVSLRPSVRH